MDKALLLAGGKFKALSFNYLFLTQLLTINFGFVLGIYFVFILLKQKGFTSNFVLEIPRIPNQ